jgi:AAHS family 4-hydroxybenzoate transporter-like MFS transporter
VKKWPDAGKSGAGGEEAMATTIDVSQLIDREKLGRYQFLTFAFCTLFLFFEGIDGQMIGYAAPAIIRDWKIDRIALGPILTTGILGTALGAMFFGILADRIGRRLSTLLCLATLGIFNVLTATAHSVETLMIYRFMVGLGIGGSMPNGYALVSEYFPHRMRATVIMLAGTGYAFGNAVCGWGAAWLIPAYGWPSVFYVGGFGPLILLLFLWPVLPESVRYLVVTNKPAARIAALLRKVNPAAAIPADARFVLREERAKGMPVKHLFTEGRAWVTIFLWITVAANLLVLSFLLNWFPTLISGAGMGLAQAMRASAMFSVGGTIGGAVLGFLIDRWGAPRVLGTGFVVTAMCVSAIGPNHGSFGTLAPLMFVIGFCVAGGNAGTSAYAGKLYPTAIRSTGIGWSLGVGRFAQLLSPILGTLMLALHWQLPAFFYAVAAPALIAAVAIFLAERSRPKDEEGASDAALKAAE